MVEIIRIEKVKRFFLETTSADEETLEEIFKSSYWVTFVDPSFDLDCFLMITSKI